MQVLVIVGANVAAREHLFEVLRELGVDRHHVFESSVLGAFLDHQDLAVALDDLRFDLADLLVHEDFMRKVAIQNLLTDFGNALGAKGIGTARPAERWLGLLVRLEQRLVGPLGGWRRIGIDAVDPLKHSPRSLSGGDCNLLNVLNRLAHDSFWLLGFSF